MKIPLFLAMLCCLATHLAAQNKASIKFGKVESSDFKTSYPLDPGAEAVIIGNIGSSDFVGNSKGSFSIEFKRYSRIHILNKNAYDAAQIRIPVYTTGEREEEIVTLKAVTYNLENGKVVETKLDPKVDVFKEKISRNWVVNKFSFPAVREGSIIEFEYKLRSEYLFRLRPWEFQSGYPTLWSEYIVGMPQFLYYVSLTQGSQEFFIKESKDKIEQFTVEIPKTEVMLSGVKDRMSFSAGVTAFRWVMKDVPALKEESYTSTISNHVAKIEFQLAEYREPYIPKKVMSTWTETASTLLDDPDFGLPLQQENAFLNDISSVASKKAQAPIDRARNIYAWVRDNMTCVERNSFYMKKSLQSTLKMKSGTEAEINILLIAMLRNEGLKADPVILSTRSNGYAYALYPLIDRFNYVIAQLVIDGQKYYLDASRPRLGFNRLGYDCYNGHARVIDAAADGLEFNADSLTEKSISSVFVSNNNKGALSASVQYTPGVYDSYDIRTEIGQKGQDAYFNELKRNGSEVKISEEKIDSIDNYDLPVSIKYRVETPLNGEDIWYFDPMFIRSWTENPFKSATRSYPVEMLFRIDQTYLLRMEVPAGYEVDELPKSLIVKLNEDNDGEFEYRTAESNGIISIRSRLRINRTYFSPEEYQMLRDFFNLVVKKQSEQIVFKKKK
ncbi:MAG: hypothetical protein DI535_12500 [Citrobacter freundii]|nr:MAG: hypothetical protein DI535_12500 [Citrobacter freundii]